ncbi:MAG: beta-propeller fold lactonase family protein [Legionellaceae bacterium]|nr:beta-propeller fold lactonase family protein [Legionellaceae bacterium]
MHKIILKFVPYIITALSITGLAEASPVWTFTPLTATTVTPPAIIQYRVTNQSSKPHTLVLSPADGMTQVTTAGNCSDALTLTSSHPSCILTLSISENASSSTLHSAPTVCEQGPNGQISSLQCYQPSPADIIQIIPQTRQQMAYIPNTGNNTVSICPVETDGNLSACTVTDGNGTIFEPFAAAINSSGTFIYIVNFGNSTLSICPINTDGMLGTCTDTTGNGALSSPTSIAINPDSTYAYISNTGTSELSICPLNPNGSLGTCQNYSNLGDTSSTFNAAGSFIYRALITSVDYCALNPDGSLATPCTPSGSGITDAFGISLNADGKFIYIANRNIDTISICSINPDGSLGACDVDDAGGTLDFTQGRIGLFMTSSTDYGYIPNRGNSTVSICSILDSGSLNACHAVTDSTFNEPAGVALFPV